MPATARPRRDVEWLSGRAAAAKAGVTIHTLAKLALLGKVRTRAIPGSPIRYNAADVERLAVGDDQPSPA